MPLTSCTYVQFFYSYSTERVVKSIVGTENFVLDSSHFECIINMDSTLIPSFCGLRTTTFLHGCLHVLPLARSQYDFSAQEFRGRPCSSL